MGVYALISIRSCDISVTVKICSSVAAIAIRKRRVNRDWIRCAGDVCRPLDPCPVIRGGNGHIRFKRIMRSWLVNPPPYQPVSRAGQLSGGVAVGQPGKANCEAQPSWCNGSF